MNVTIAGILDKRRMLKKTKSYPIAIRIIFNRKSVLFPTDLHLSSDDWNKLGSPRLGERLSQVKDKLSEEKKRAKRIIEKLGTFTFEAFRKEFYKYTNREKKLAKKGMTTGTPVSDPAPDNYFTSKPEGKNKKYGKRKYDRIRSNVDYGAMGPLAVAFGEKIKLLEVQERIGTSEAYFTSLLCLLSFRPKLRIEDITCEFLYEFENWMLKKDNSYSTIGIYLRNLRAIINLPKNKKLLSSDDYPFGKGKYQIPTGINVKKALELSDIKKIYDYHPENPSPYELYARDMWLFGYFANGINPKDIAHLKYENIHDDFIVIRREKTKFTTRSNPIPIYIAINEDMQAIINRWGNANKDPKNFIFPVLEEGLSPHRRRELIYGFIGLINDWMKIIAKNVGITKKVRTMEYRHSAATIMRNSGVSTEFIKDFLGHQSLKTTQNYLDSFGDAVKKEFGKRLLAFKELKE